MTEHLEKLADQLAAKEVDEITIDKEDFTNFAEIIRKREDFKHFKGIAQKGGVVIYEYMDEPRS